MLRILSVIIILGVAISAQEMPKKLDEETLALLKSVAEEEKILQLIKERGVTEKIRENLPTKLAALGFSSQFIQKAEALLFVPHQKKQRLVSLEAEQVKLKQEMIKLRRETSEFRQLLEKQQQQIRVLAKRQKKLAGLLIEMKRSLSSQSQPQPPKAKEQPQSESFTKDNNPFAMKSPSSPTPPPVDAPAQSEESEFNGQKDGAMAESFMQEAPLQEKQQQRSDNNKQQQQYEEVITWSQQAAEKGNTMAMTTLGYMYLRGLRVEQDSQKAIFWFKKAAANGNPTAMISLGDIYFEGKVVNQDLQKAQEWYEKALDAGDQEAVRKLRQLEMLQRKTRQE